jgi:hypothetical protein
MAPFEVRRTVGSSWTGTVTPPVCVVEMARCSIAMPSDIFCCSSRFSG